MLRRLRFIAALPLLLTLLLAACGTDEDATSTPAGGGSADPTGTAAPSPTDESDATATPGAIDLVGTEWELASLNGEELPPDVTITLAFEQGQLGGNAGCNEYGGAFTASDTGDLSITDLHNTDMACGEPEGVMDHETSYLEALGNAASYRVVDDQLELASADGETTLVFVPDTASALDGTSWLMIELDGQYPVTDTHITIAFEGDGVTGSAGCNDYWATYEASEGKLSFTDLAIQEKGCGEPEGVMEQEQTYVDLLMQAASYRFIAPNSWMELLDDSGQVLIVFANREEPNGAGFLDGTGWVLTHINGQEVDPGPPATLIFRSSQYTGEYGCLIYAGRFNTTSKGEILDMPVDPSEWNCERSGPPDLSETYIGALKRVTQYRLTGDRLDLLDEVGKIILSYRPGLTDQGELDGTTWELVDLNGSSLIPETEITLSFANGSASGNAGCNGYGGDYTIVDVGKISIPELASTAMGCEDPPGVLDQEVAYLQALYGVTGYRLTDDRLELLNEAGDVVLVYQQVGKDQRNLDGTSWDLVTLNGAPLIDGTQITLSFSDGSVLGNGGCNDYGGDYVIVEDGVISIPGVGATEIACEEPPGVMDQESAYNDALTGVVTYQQTGNTLELLNELGETTLVFERQSTGD